MKYDGRKHDGLIVGGVMTAVLVVVVGLNVRWDMRQSEACQKAGGQWVSRGGMCVKPVEYVKP